MSGLTWDRSPSQLADAIEKYAEDILILARTAAESISKQMQEYAQAAAPWNDITGDARAGLLTTVIATDGSITIVLYHTEFYGLFLEVCNGGKYRVILPTVVTFAALYMALLQAALSA